MSDLCLSADWLRSRDSKQIHRIDWYASNRFGIAKEEQSNRLLRTKFFLEFAPFAPSYFRLSVPFSSVGGSFQ